MIGDGSDFNVEGVADPWDCKFGDYDSLPVWEDDEIVDSAGIIEDCTKDSPPYCKFCPKRTFE